MFESLTLPSLAALAETQSDFHHVILISPDMPTEWLNRLNKVCGRYSWVHIQPVAFEKSISSVSLEFLKTLKIKGRRVFNFRLDDDDALANDYCSAVEAAVSTAPDGTVISFEKGFLVKRLKGGRFIAAEKMQPWFCGVDLRHAILQVPTTEGFSRAGRKIPVSRAATTVD